MVPCTSQRLSSAVSMGKGGMAPELLWPRSSRSSPDALAAEAWLAAGASPIGAPLLARSFSGPTPGSSGLEFARDGGSKGRCSHGWGALLREAEESRVSFDLPALSSPRDCPTCPPCCGCS